MAALTGGEKLMAYLKTIDTKVGASDGGYGIRVGFLEGVTYPDGTSLPMIAAQNEFGGTIQREAGTITVYRKVAASGTHFLRNGRFVKRREANFSTTHAVGAYSITILPRPYFRTMIKEKGPTWGPDIAKLLKANDFDAIKVLGLMGVLIKRQLQESIRNWTTPPNAPSTIARKGFNDPLIDTGYMVSRVDYESTGRSRDAGSFGGIAANF